MHHSLLRTMKVSLLFSVAAGAAYEAEWIEFQAVQGARDGEIHEGDPCGLDGFARLSRLLRLPGCTPAFPHGPSVTSRGTSRGAFDMLLRREGNRAGRGA